ncbi:MAG: hypothetical protein K2U26_13320, partial [Cyclobacteriaceae bacterium]|nr:hypothetical protein [Cyclobacteriaceae bacterium]
MKKLTYTIAAITIGLVIASCGGKKEATNAEEYVANESEQKAQAGPDIIAQGEALVKASDCK